METGTKPKAAAGTKAAAKRLLARRRPRPSRVRGLAKREALAAAMRGFSPPELVITPAAMDRMARNPRLYDGVRIVIDVRTPEGMRSTLAMHGGMNRRPIKSNMGRLVADMEAGDYVEDLRTKLVIDSDGNIIDGGNTAESIVRSGKDILLASLENVPSDVQDVIDQGTKRTAPQINEIKDAKEGKARGFWPEVTRVVKAMWWIEGRCPGATEMAVASFARLNEGLIRQVIALSGTLAGDPSSYPRLKLAPVRAAFFSYALYRKGGIVLVRRTMGKIREMRFARRGDACKAFLDAFSADHKTTNLSGAKSIRDLFPLAAATLLAEEHGLKLNVGKLIEMAADPGTMAEFMAPCRAKSAATR